MTSARNAVRGMQVRAKRAVRRAYMRTRPFTRLGLRALRRAPVPHGVRVFVSRVLLRRIGLTKIPVEHLLLGPQEGRSAHDYFERSHDLMWSSTRVADGPHVTLLRQAEAQTELSDEEILVSPYGAHARRCVELFGHYFWATDDGGVVQVARAFIARYRGEGMQPRRRGQSEAEPVRVQPVRGSDLYQVIDGHHRLAIDITRGARAVRVKSHRFSTTTPLQDMLRKMSWLDGVRQLYQPIDAPELARSWVTIRRCDDRLDKMRAFLAERQLMPPTTRTYLDIASCYGWFVSQMGRLGYEAEGVERDPLARTLGEAAYGLHSEQVTTGDVVDFLDASKRWDVVSCFSLLHHFAMGRGTISAEELIRRMDAATGSVLFFDTGQSHEEWFRDLLPEWDTQFIAKFLAQNSSFDEVVDLGPDADAVPPFEKNYGRHLFACVRHQ